jgi:hypothetical protein
MLNDTQLAFDNFYNVVLSQYNLHYPPATVTITSRDPSFVTPTVKALLRRKNRLMHKGHTEQASALAKRIGVLVMKSNTCQLCSESTKGCAKKMWSKVNEITNKQKRVVTEGLDPDTLNTHYAAISADCNYQAPLLKHTCTETREWLSEYAVYSALVHLKPTATGLDGLPAWFLRTAAPVIAKPLACLFNLSLRESTVPTQWKTACITPIPKIPQAQECSDFRPISITPVLSRTMEKLVTRWALYPTLQLPLVALNLNDQYAFRPTGSTTAALIAILQDMSEMSVCNDYVQIIALDFSKAFDTVRHSSLMSKIATLPIPDFLYNWIVNYLEGRAHRTKSCNTMSVAKSFNAGVVQGSALGPVAYIINASDLKVRTQGNKLHKYADDTYLIVPSRNRDTVAGELAHIARWANENNLQLNTKKSTEMVVTKIRYPASNMPPPIPGVQRVTSLNILGVTVQHNLQMTEHVTNLVTAGHQNLYALKVLKQHGLHGNELSAVCRATLVAKLAYASQAWRGFVNCSDKSRLLGVMSKATRWGVYSRDSPDYETIIDRADQVLFRNVLSNSSHVLFSKLPPVKQICYNLRDRPHNRELPVKTLSTERNFFIRMLYSKAF